MVMLKETNMDIDPDLRAAAKHVLASWERGDLAAAVGALRAALEDTPPEAPAPAILIDKATALQAYDALVQAMRAQKPIADKHGGPHREMYLAMQRAANDIAAAVLKEKVTQ